MRVGSLCFATDQGIGYMAKDFVTNGVITDVMMVRHGRRQDHPEWYPGAETIYDLNNVAPIHRFIHGIDVMLFIETPFNWSLIDFCRDIGVPTALIVMMECMPRVLPSKPDLIICPSSLDKLYYPTGVHIPVPVDVPWRQRTKAEVFVHNAGNGGLRGRNGTAELVQAMRLTKSPAKLILRQQVRQDWPPYSELLDKVDYQVGTQPSETLWDDGDVFCFPDKFNGLSLPLQEARAAGMLVMSSNRFPANEWLPPEPLIPVSSVARACVSPRCNDFDEAILDPRDIARTIDEWYGKDIADYGLAGKAWAEGMTWEVLRPRYLDALKGLLR